MAMRLDKDFDDEVEDDLTVYAVTPDGYVDDDGDVVGIQYADVPDEPPVVEDEEEDEQEEGTVRVNGTAYVRHPETGDLISVDTGEVLPIEAFDLDAHVPLDFDGDVQWS